MSLAYNLNQQMAREGDNTGTNRITETGPYVGVFPIVKAVTSDKGTQGLEFSFESNDGQKANYMTLWTRNAKGESIYGEKVLNAVMTCAKVRSLNPIQKTIKEYDFDAKQEVDKIATVYPELMNTPIGVVLQKEQYEKNSGGIGEKMTLYSAFDANTRQTAIEVFDKLPAERLERLLESVKDKLLPPKANNYQPVNNFENTDDDDLIPF